MSVSPHSIPTIKVCPFAFLFVSLVIEWKTIFFFPWVAAFSILKNLQHFCDCVSACMFTGLNKFIVISVYMIMIIIIIHLYL
jgi:hypothetical protein